MMSALGSAEASTYAVVLLGLDLQPMTSPSELVAVNTYELVMINPGPVAIDVEIRNISESIAFVTIDPGDLGRKTIDPNHSMNGTELANKTILVSSEGIFTLQVFSSSPTHTEGYMGIPLESLLGPHQIQNVYEYVISSYCASSGYCQIALTAFERAQVKFTFPVKRSDDIVFCVGKKYFRGNRDRVLVVEKFHALQIESTMDLSGTHIYSFSPIVVFVGSRNITVAGGTTHAHMVEQLPPASQWGSTFVVTPLSGTDFGDIIRISSTWSNTKVDISGYPSFIISKRSNVVTRRLEKDSVALITANHPIQVIQVTGITFATADESLSVSMVTVPAIEHADDVINMACGSADTFGKFKITSDRIDAAVSINGAGLLDETLVEYSPYKINTGPVSISKVYKVAGTRFSGMVVCANNAAVPLSVVHNTNNMNAQGSDTAYGDTTCIDGASGVSSFSDSGQTAIEYDDFGRFSILKLRTILCGEALLTFRATNGVRISFRLAFDSVTVTFCTDSCIRQDVIEDGFNSGRLCESDMAWYWVRVIRQAATPTLCFGFGPLVNTEPDCTSAPFKHNWFDGALRIDSFSLMGIFVDAHFNYDLETDAGCVVWVSSWRCADKIENCSSYDKEFCTNGAYEAFSNNVCPKYCGKCQVDSFGRKFVFLMADSHWRNVIVVPRGETARIGVATNNSTLRPYRQLNAEIYYIDGSYKAASDTVWVIADIDVGVTALQYRSAMPQRLRSPDIQAYNVYPVDGFSNNYLIMTGCENEQCVCDIITESEPVDIVAYSRETLSQGNDATIVDGLPFTVYPHKVTSVLAATPGGLNKGATVLQSEKPFGVFCCEDTTRSYTQMVPKDSHGIHYRLPKLNFENLQENQTFSLYIQAVHPNTHVTVSGDRDSVFMLKSIGQMVRFDVNTEFAYDIESNNPIAVGLLFRTHNVGILTRTLTRVPPVTDFINSPLVSGIWGWGKGVTYISKSGQSEFVNETEGSIGTIAEEKFGIQLYQLWNYTFILPSSSLLSSILEDPCATSSLMVKDGIDNDCDGLVDEDLCSLSYGIYGKDGDLDGDFGEDCRDIIHGPVITTRPPEPTCIPLPENTTHCLALCSCPCTWVTKLEAYQNLTSSERHAKQAIKLREIQDILKIDVTNLTSTKSRKISAVDHRQSAASVGYIGLAMFTVVFGSIFLMDIKELFRDLCMICANLRDGLRRLQRRC